jgi:hypothetical protein
LSDYRDVERLAFKAKMKAHYRDQFKAAQVMKQSPDYDEEDEDGKE